MLLFDTVPLQFSRVFPSFYKSAEVFVGIMQKLADMLLSVFIVLKLNPTLQVILTVVQNMTVTWR